MTNYRIIRNDAKGMFFKYIDDDNIYSAFKKVPHIIKRGMMKFHLPFRTFLYGTWKKNLNDCDIFILFDSDMYPDIIKYIKKKNKHCKVILYYWNVINEFNQCFLSNPLIDEVWSFDKVDCKKYQLRYNCQLYSNNVLSKSENEENKILFLGREKGRKNQILEFKEYCTNQDIKTDFLIIESEKDLISYEKYLNMVANCNTLLDIIDDRHFGLTLRVMESIFLRKKLITNNSDIINYDFYCKENIFILGKDSLEDLPKFIAGNYKNLPKRIINQYDYESWLQNFFRK